MKYFTLDEFRCKHCGELPANGMNPKLLEGLDKLREAWGAPIYTSCGYRCPVHNAEVNGVPNSQHVLGNAADIYVDGGIEEYRRFLQLVRGMRLFDATGEYNTSMFVHVDCRSNGTEINEYSWVGD